MSCHNKGIDNALNVTYNVSKYSNNDIPFLIMSRLIYSSSY